ncbi:hypothetical protein DFH08DRAFT_893384 [Mycena albidolilacea]|uniref:Chitinase n=1 Tax=Mycena albidolilacea TaxID=1033008 RepID=A0AAD6ZCN5_9AGAR|nr:hypothetical protein DFH08DRAFT_893384 [Mycena albidolilacea]
MHLSIEPTTPRAGLPLLASPVGYWFLKAFEIDKTAGNVSYMNMMYDYHGHWDTNVKDRAPVADPHASILDTGTGAELYMHAGIN